jgi:hypothetical protein
VVFRPLRRTQTFRFWRAFRDLKHERTESLQAHDDIRPLKAAGIMAATPVTMAPEACLHAGIESWRAGGPQSPEGGPYDRSADRQESAG